MEREQKYVSFNVYETDAIKVDTKKNFFQKLIGKITFR